MNKKFDKIIKTYKNILASKEKDKSDLHFFALKSLETVDIKNIMKKNRKLLKL